MPTAVFVPSPIDVDDLIARRSRAADEPQRPVEDARAVRGGSSWPAESLLALQRTAGNHAVSSLVEARRGRARDIQRQASESGATGTATGEPARTGASSTSETVAGDAAPSGRAAGDRPPAPSSAAAQDPDGGGDSPAPAAPVDLAALGLEEFAEIAGLLDPSLWRAYTIDPNRETAYEVARGLGPILGPMVGGQVLCLSRVTSFGIPFALLRLIRLCHRWCSYGQNDPRTQEALIEAFSSSGPLLSATTALCDCIQPWLIAYFYLWELREYPDAHAHLAHYLKGSGAPIDEPLERLIAEDHRVKAAIERRIEDVAAPRGRLEPAVDTFGYANKNWNYALGGIDLMLFEILDDPASRAANAASTDGTAAVRLELHDKYEWHPDETRYMPCLHSAMENMKMWGAQDFWEEGQRTVRLALAAHLIPT